MNQVLHIHPDIIGTIYKVDIAGIQIEGILKAITAIQGK